MLSARHFHWRNGCWTIILEVEHQTKWNQQRSQQYDQQNRFHIRQKWTQTVIITQHSLQ